MGEYIPFIPLAHVGDWKQLDRRMRFAVVSADLSMTKHIHAERCLVLFSDASWLEVYVCVYIHGNADCLVWFVRGRCTCLLVVARDSAFVRSSYFVVQKQLRSLLTTRTCPAVHIRLFCGRVCSSARAGCVFVLFSSVNL